MCKTAMDGSVGVWHWTGIFGLIVLVIVAGSLTFWEFYVRPDVAPASIEKMAYPLPDKPSIAVLPFDNMSKDPDQDYFSDGITEEIITALAKIQGLFVIARNSTFECKGKPVKIQQVAEDLGVRYVLEGSVRKSEDKIRITAQLIDASGWIPFLTPFRLDSTRRISLDPAR